MYSLHGAFIIRHISASFQREETLFWNFRYLSKGMLFFFKFLQGASSGTTLASLGAISFCGGEGEERPKQPFRHHASRESQIVFSVESEASDGTFSCGRFDFFRHYFGSHDFFERGFRKAQLRAA